MAHHDSTHNNLRNSSSPSDSDEPSWRQEKKLDQEAQHFESAPPVEGEYTNETDPRITRFTPAEQRKIIHKVDRRLTVTLGVLYCISLMDRTNLSAANIAGMSKDLRLDLGDRYSIITLMFFIPYIFFQPPATVLMRKVGPTNFITTICLLWGCLLIGFGFVNQWTEMLGLRVILGVLEAGFFPGSVYLMSTWYSRYDLQKRYAVFYVIGSVAAAFAGILAYGLMQMEGLANIRGWRWIFIMEGILTCVVAIFGYFMLIDFPDKAKRHKHFLTDAEVDFVVARIDYDRADAAPTEFKIKEYLANMGDLKVWAFAALFGLSTTTTYAIAYFLPVILREGMGFDVAQAQCLVAPPFVAAGIWMYVQAVFSDKYRQRGLGIFVNAIITAVGMCLLGFVDNNGVRYFGVFLATMGSYANVPSVLTYQANNIRGQWKRALCSATLVGSGGIGGIIGSTVFRQQDAPGYKWGIVTCILANGLIVLIVAALTLKFKRANKRVDNGGKMIEGQVGFKYTL